MSKDELKHLFDRLDGKFDVHQIQGDHQKRFLERLQAQKPKTNTIIKWWKPISVAASIIVLIGIGFNLLSEDTSEADLASVSPEMEQAQSFFSATISNEMQTLESYSTPETQSLVNDALEQMDVLENQYEKLKIDLVKSGNDQRVIYAMIANFQNRIDLLKQVISTIKEVKNLNTRKDEITM